MTPAEFFPASLRVAFLWGGLSPEHRLLPAIRFLADRGAVVDIGLLPGANPAPLADAGLAWHTDNAYLATFIGAPGCKCLVTGTRQGPVAPAVIDLCAKHGVPAIDAGGNGPAVAAGVLAVAAARHDAAQPRERAADGRPLFADIGYERYVRLMGIAQAVAPPAGEPLAVLDIGGEDAALQQFLPGAGYETFNGFITREQGTGLADGCCDVVVAADVLEHVPPADREAFLRELVRLARRRVVFSFPCADAALHERFLLEILPRHRWLAEHQDHGLPDAGAVASLLEGLGLAFERRPNHTLRNWAYSVLFDMMPLSPDLARALNLFLQEHAYPLEGAEPAYRHIFVVDT